MRNSIEKNRRIKRNKYSKRSNNPDTVTDDGLGFNVSMFSSWKWNCFIFKIWKLETVGSIITTKARKLDIDKYLHFHIGFFKEDDNNAPGVLLTRLSIDTNQLNILVLNGCSELGFVLSSCLVRN